VTTTSHVAAGIEVDCLGHDLDGACATGDKSDSLEHNLATPYASPRKFLNIKQPLPAAKK
jgi:hypothetical protein